MDPNEKKRKELQKRRTREQARQRKLIKNNEDTTLNQFGIKFKI